MYVFTARSPKLKALSPEPSDSTYTCFLFFPPTLKEISASAQVDPEWENGVQKARPNFRGGGGSWFRVEGGIQGLGPTLGLRVA